MKQGKEQRIVRKIVGGEQFIETRKADWLEAVDRWRADKTKPCPMIEGHYMFKHPEDYGCELLPF